MNNLLLSWRTGTVPVLLLTALSVVTTACGSGRSQTDVSSLPTTTPTATDSARTRSLNAQIQAAANRDSFARSRDADAVYRIGPNDQIEVQVFNAEDFSGTHRVDESGEIAIPLLGSVMAAGLTPRELEADLEERLAESYMHDPHVSIQVTEIQSHGVSVVGAVQAPGVYQLSGPSSLLEVIALAGGLTEEAGGDVFVVRARDRSFDPADVADADATRAAELASNSDVLRADLGVLLESGDASENVVVLAGDIVQVRPAGLVYVVGEVNRPGGFPIPAGQPMTVLQALAMAEGLGNTALASESVIVREDRYGNRTEVPVDLEAVLDGDEGPPMLEARDVLFVPNNGVKSFGLGVVNALVGMVSLRGLFY
jgi:polysaccharide export outer membrane protein